VLEPKVEQLDQDRSNSLADKSGKSIVVLLGMAGAGMWLLEGATTRYFYALKIYGAILPQNKQILCHNFTIKQHWTIFSSETLTDWQRATS
jgi:hypothetical protein